MSNQILKSQADTFNGNYGSKWLKELENAAPDILSPQGAKSAIGSQVYNIQYLAPATTSRTSFSAFTDTYQIPSTFGWLSHVYISFIPTQDSSNAYTANVAMNAIKYITVKNGSNVLCQYDYATVNRYCLRRLDISIRSRLMELAGAAAAAPGLVCAPIWLPFANISSNREIDKYLFLGGLSSPLTIEIQFDVSTGLSAGTVAYTDMRLWYGTIESNALPNDEVGKQITAQFERPFVMTNWLTLENLSGALPTNTQRTDNISSLSGILTEIEAQDVLVSNYDHATARNRITQEQDIDTCYLSVNNSNYNQVASGSNLEPVLQMMTLLTSGQNAGKNLVVQGTTVSDLGSGTVCEFSGSLDSALGADFLAGFLNTSGSSQRNMIIRHQDGANAYISYCAAVYQLCARDSSNNWSIVN